MLNMCRKFRPGNAAVERIEVYLDVLVIVVLSFTKLHTGMTIFLFDATTPI